VPDDGCYVSRNTLYDLQQSIVTHTVETDDPLCFCFSHITAVWPALQKRDLSGLQCLL